MCTIFKCEPYETYIYTYEDIEVLPKSSMITETEAGISDVIMFVFFLLEFASEYMRRLAFYGFIYR